MLARPRPRVLCSKMEEECLDGGGTCLRSTIAESESSVEDRTGPDESPRKWSYL